MNKRKIIILGKLPPPFFGPAIATEILLKSRLKNEFDLIHIDTRLNTSILTVGKFGWEKIYRTIAIFKKYYKALSDPDATIVLIPIAQETSALIKDTFFIILARIRSKKIIIQLRGSALLKWYEKQFILWRFFFRQVYSKCSGAIVLGQNLKYIFEPFLPSDKIFVVPNGSDYLFPLRSDKFKKVNVLYFANLQGSKGIEDLLSGIGLISESNLNRLILNVVGSWRDYYLRKKCMEFVQTNDLPVVFNHPMKGQSKWQIFADSDIFVFPPRAPEGHPWVIIEAMAAGLPVISTDQGAITESVVHGLNGFIVEPYSPAQIAEKIEFLINNPGEREKMGKESRRLYEGNFTEEIMVKNLSDVFTRVLNN